MMDGELIKMVRTLKFLILTFLMTNCDGSQMFDLFKGEEITKARGMDLPNYSRNLPEWTDLFKIKGSSASEKLVLIVQGGPRTEIRESNFEYIGNYFPLVYIHQAQTLDDFDKEGWNEKKFSWVQQERLVKKSVDILYKVIWHFKIQMKTIYVVGYSFGAFLVSEMLARYGNPVDKVILMGGRLKVSKEAYKIEKQDRKSVYFLNGQFVQEFNIESLRDEGKMRLHHGDSGRNGLDGLKFLECRSRDQNEIYGLGICPNADERITEEYLNKMDNISGMIAVVFQKNYIQELKDKDMRNVLYVYGYSDTRVGRLSLQEINFLRQKGSEIHMDLDHNLSQESTQSKVLDFLLERGIEEGE